MNRRQFLKSSASIAGSTFAATSLTACGNPVDKTQTNGAKAKASAKSGQLTWTNWSELQSCHPAAILSPTSEAELSDVIKKSSKVRFVGSGHSFTPLVPTDQTIISLDPLSGITHHDTEKLTATVLAGTKLSQMARDLDSIGQAPFNLPDITYQTLAGAISTATHGTGHAFPALHGYAKEIKLMIANGDLLVCNETENAEIFQAAKVSLGSLGAITEVTLQNRKPFSLHRKVWVQPLDFVMQNGKELFEKHSHFELYYLPHTNLCILISHDEYDGSLQPRATTPDEDGLAQLAMLRDMVPSAWRPWFIRLVLSPGKVLEDAKDQSWRLLAQPRVSKFNESEFHIPKAQGFECFKQVCDKIDSFPDTYFPIEFRLIKADNAWISPFYESDRHSIAVHASYDEPYQYLITDIDPILKAHQGRPHWGKLNDLGFNDFAALYPRWHDFLNIREKLDPHGKFLNDYTRKIFNL